MARHGKRVGDRLTLVPEHGHVAGVGGEADEVEDQTVDHPVWQRVPERRGEGQEGAYREEGLQ